MNTEVDVNNGTLILRLAGSPENGGNRNNYVEGDVDPARQRFGLGGGTGLTGNLPFADGYRLIGSAGVTAHVASNVGVSADRAVRQHDNSFDAPLGPHAMGAFEMRDVLNQVVAQTGGTGDLGKLTVGQATTILAKHPNLIEPAQFAQFQNAVAKLETPIGIPKADLAQAQQAIDNLYKAAQANGTLETNITNINADLAKVAPGLKLSPGAEAIVQSTLDRAGSNGKVTIGQLYQESQTLMPALSKTYVPADYIMPMTLSQINGAAQNTENFIASKGGPAGVSNQIVSSVDGVLALNPSVSPGEATADAGKITSSINAILAANGQPPLSAGITSGIQSSAVNITSTLNNYLDGTKGHSLPPGVAGQIQNDVATINTDANKVTSLYNERPSATDVLHYQHLANKLVALDPALDVKAFVAGALMAPRVNTAVVAQQGANVNVQDAQYVAGKGFGIHPDLTHSLRGEMGIGPDGVSFSTETARKLNLALPKGTETGAYVFAERDTDRWMGISGTRKINEVGVGASIGKSMGGNREGIVSIEGGVEHTGSTVPGDTPKETGKFVGVRAIFKF